MRFTEASLGDNVLNIFEDCSDLIVDIQGVEGQYLALIVEGAQDVVELASELRHESGEPANRSADQNGRDTEGHRFFARIYRFTRTGLHRLSVGVKHATVTLIKFGQDIVDAARQIREPTRATCLFCTTVLKTIAKVLLTAHGVPIPTIGTLLGHGLTHLRNVAQLLETLHEWFPPLEEFYKEAVVSFVDHIKRIPAVIRDPIGVAAGYACQAMRQCPASVQ